MASVEVSLFKHPLNQFRNIAILFRTSNWNDVPQFRPLSIRVGGISCPTPPPVIAGPGGCCGQGPLVALLYGTTCHCVYSEVKLIQYYN